MNEDTAIQIDDLMPGAALIRVGELRLALGFPEEVVKSWLANGRQPNAWLIPDLRAARGIVQWALEFPLYHALFVEGVLAGGTKMPVLVTRRDWPDVVEYLRLSLLGLTADEMLAEDVEPTVARMLAEECAHLAVKRADGSVLQIEDMLEPHFFDEGRVAMSGLRIERHGNNTYSFCTPDDKVERYHLEPAGSDALPYALAGPSAAVLPQPFEVVALGTSTGFDPTGPCSNLVVQASGRFIAIDCGPYIRQTLRHAGINASQLSAVVLTHCHEDHAVGLLSLVGSKKRLKLFVTRENAAIMRRKLEILDPERTLEEAFDLVFATAGVAVDYLGLRLRFHYTMHAIPCTGVELSMPDGAGQRRALVVGDNNSRANIEFAAQQGLMSTERLERLLALYRWDGDLIVADAGGGQIHGVAEDFADSPAHRVVCVHTPELALQDRQRYSLAEPGHRYTLIPENARPTSLERSLAFRSLSDAFVAFDPDDLAAMLDTAVAQSVNRGQVVVREEDATEELYVVIAGEFCVTVGRGAGARQVATIGPGEIFGELAAATAKPRSASVKAQTPARIVCISGEAFRQLVQANDLLTALPDLLQRRLRSLHCSTQDAQLTASV